MAIRQRRILDLASFRDATAAPRDTAALYFYKQLDPFFESASAISKDFFARPQLYTKIFEANPSNGGAGNGGAGNGGAGNGGAGNGGAGNGGAEPTPSVVELLARLRSRCGSDEFFPSPMQRLEIYAPLFWTSRRLGELR
jgi:hypothetical protein